MNKKFIEVKRVCEIPRKMNMYKALLDVDYIGVTPDGKVINLNTYEELSKREHEGYFLVHIENKQYYIHRLVALLYKEKDDDKNVVFHMNKNTLDNRYTNLMWVTQSFVSVHRKDFKVENKGREIILVDKNGEDLKIYENGGIAAKELGLNRSEIYRVCKGVRNHAGGYKFKYA